MGFWRGIITGSLLGAAVSMFLKPQRKPERMIMNTTRQAGKRAQKMMKGMTRRVNEMIK
ncbi:YtxH domain-containing protein [Desulforamulus ferrireducens]|uniref:YtxH domain-containing protein n=1 Tax=Desulforamulus ferrireducens TaxID=1833852 RepID=UPI0011EA5348|nr:YtxH domain-containing protein [Desulforamulus ferrireducens]